MKKLAVVVAVAGLLSACGSTGLLKSDNYSNRAQDQASLQNRAVQNNLDQMPSWMTQIPKSDNAVYATGTARHPDLEMSGLVAKTMAYAKICTTAGGTVRSQQKVFGNDSGVTTELAIRSMCKDVDITGVETVDIKRVAEGNTYRTYVLVALPLGDANLLRTTKVKEALAVEVKERAPGAFKELDDVTKSTPAGNTSQRTESVNVVKSDGTTSTLNLMPVDNAEYKARRAEAVQKPGAVVGQTSVN
jgi:type II secretory pathway pseudopilin PulG